MKRQLLLLSIMMIIMSSMNLNVFRRLRISSKQYKTDNMFYNVCHVSKKYVKKGYIISIIMFIISVIFLIMSSIYIYKIN